MNALDILKYGHKTFTDSLEGLEGQDWEEKGVTTSWNIKDTLSHITSYELLLKDVILSLIDKSEPTAYLDMVISMSGTDFNNLQVEQRKRQSHQEIMDEYQKAHSEVLNLASKIPAELFTKNGTLPWYGKEYSLDDYIVYSNYGHKREHAAQIKIFRKKLETK